jgi:murein DD-endopeptidase MepM/ murein hydrolase activator NlpD
MNHSFVAPDGSSRRSCAAAVLVTSTILLASACAGSHRESIRTTEVAGVPAAPVAAREQQGVRHVVEAGQTLWRIAQVYGVSIDDLARSNDIADPSSLIIGQSLFIPRARAVLEVPPYPAPLTGGSSTVAAPTDRPRFEWPVSGGRILSGYDAPRQTHRHKGIDIGAPHGRPVRAADSGRVVYSGSTLRGYGKTVIIDHGDEVRSLYAHNSDLLVGEGSPVERGQIIARVGRSGNASTEHCHFEIRKNDVPVDPIPYLKRATESTR